MNTDLKDLLNDRDIILQHITEIKNDLEKANDQLTAVDLKIGVIIEEPVRQARKLTGKDTGTVDVFVQGVMVKHAQNKKVEWDQEKLAEIKKLILKHNDNPDDYITTKTTYSVDEKKFKKFLPDVQVVFEPARTVNAGKQKLTFDTNWRS